MFKKIVKFLGVVIVVSALFSSCTDTEPKDSQKVAEVESIESKNKEFELSITKEDEERQREERYMAFLQDNTQKFREALGRFASNGELTPYTDEWYFKMALSIAETKEVCDEGLAYTDVPNKFREADAKYKEALTLYRNSMEELPYLIDNMDSQGIRRVTGYMDTANTKIQESTALFESIK